MASQIQISRAFLLEGNMIDVPEYGMAFRVISDEPEGFLTIEIGEKCLAPASVLFDGQPVLCSLIKGHDPATHQITINETTFTF